MSARLFQFRSFLYRTSSSVKASIRDLHLSPDYSLRDKWNSRLETTLLQQIRVDEFYVELKKRFDASKDGSALDVEILANRVTRRETIPKLMEIVEAFRVSKNTYVHREGISHAVIRLHLDFELYDDLLKILNDKIKYGIFLDAFTANLLMDKFLELGRPQDAVKIAIDLMLQEDFSQPTTRDLALLSCLTFLKNPEWTGITSYKPIPPPVDTGEEVIVYLTTIRNPFFDDHFDTTEPKHLVGKTLYIAGRTRNDILGRSSQIIGLGMYEKWDKAVAILEFFLRNQNSIHKEAFDAFYAAIKEAPKTPEGTFAKPPPRITDPLAPIPGVEVPGILDANALLAKVEALGNELAAKNLLDKENVAEKAELQVKETLKQCFAEDISKQNSLYDFWIKNREDEVKRLVRKFEIDARLKELQTKRSALQTEEDHLFFFERKNQWEKLLTPNFRQKLIDQETSDGSSFDFRVEHPDFQQNQIQEPTAYARMRPWLPNQKRFDFNQEYIKNIVKNRPFR